MKDQLGCRVQRSADGKLLVLDGFLKKRFGAPPPPKGKTFGGTCLLANVVAIESAITGISERAIFNLLMPHLPSCDINGHKLHDLLSALDIEMGVMDVAIKSQQHIGKRGVFKKSTVERHCKRLNIEDSIDHVCAGRPVIVIVNSHMAGRFDAEALLHQDGIVGSPIIGSRVRHQEGFHSYVWFGLDTDGYALLRDSRDKYSFKGYLKVHIDILGPAVKISKGALLGYCMQTHECQ